MRTDGVTFMTTYTYPEFGAGLRHFSNYIDRYAVDGYGPVLSTIDQIKAAKEFGGTTELIS